MVTVQTASNGVITKYVNIHLKAKLRKDLLPGEEICDECKGAGVVLGDHPFGISTGLRSGFPYKKQAFHLCPSCYAGVRRRCVACGELLSLGQARCTCEATEELRRKELQREEEERWEKAEKIAFEEAVARYEKVYVEDWDEFVTPGELEDRMVRENLPAPKRVYGTTSASLKLDARQIVANACEELHDAAWECISDELLTELQSILDTWCEKTKEATVTYYPDFRVAVVVQ